MKFELTTLDEYTDEALISELQRVAQALEGQRLTRQKFDSLARVHSSTLHNRFGSWARALDKARISDSVAPRVRVLSRDEVLQALREFAAENPGQSTTEKVICERLGLYRGAVIRRFGKWEAILAEVGLATVPLGRRYTDEECFENILRLWTHYGRQPNFGELKRPPSEVGPKAYIRRWGGWRAALSAFVRQVNETATPSAEVIQLTAALPVANSTAVSVPRSITLALRYRVLARDKFRCVICGASPAKDGSVELHVDHIFPWSRGGQNVEENLRSLCFKCNLGKGALIEDVR
ncbi:MAG: HNH endonuclease [Burkholderiaceae bacterium]|nr:MAG: HNH endonuclease [Burkholderiaceae bacterium]